MRRRHGRRGRRMGGGGENGRRGGEGEEGRSLYITELKSKKLQSNKQCLQQTDY
jgi:hypothetical protein